jgi:C4-type Zn-finger protein
MRDDINREFTCPICHAVIKYGTQVPNNPSCFVMEIVATDTQVCISCGLKAEGEKWFNKINPENAAFANSLRKACAVPVLKQWLHNR